MKKIKLTAVLLVCSVLLAAVLGGCSKTPVAEPVEETQKTAEKETSNEAKQEKEEPEGLNETEQKPEDSSESVQEESEADEPEESETDKIFAAYREILKAAPAIEGDHPELTDASLSYEQNLEMFGNHYELFALYDMNQDDIPELIALSTVNFRWTFISVYTYMDGEAVLLKDPANTEAPGSFDQRSTANGAFTTYFCEENHIHSVWRGMTPLGEAEENYAYAIADAAVTVVDCSNAENENTVNFYDIAKENTAENVEMMFH